MIAENLLCSAWIPNISFLRKQVKSVKAFLSSNQFSGSPLFPYGIQYSNQIIHFR